MSNDVKFNEWRPSQEYTPRQKPKMVRWVLKIGLAKDEKQANHVLLGIVVVAIIFLIIFYVSDSGGAKPLYEEDIMGPNGFPMERI